MNKHNEIPLIAYDRLQTIWNADDLFGNENKDALTECINECIGWLEEKEREDLISNVPNKEYFAFMANAKTSRAVNKSLYISRKSVVTIWNKLSNAITENNFRNISSEEINKAVYTAAIAFCACIDLLKVGDQKTPGTFFEYLIGHLFSRRLGKNPTKRLEVLNLDRTLTLPTDYVFNLGVDRPKFHLPIKTSTRERVIQVWAHQRVLDGAYGTGRFLGTPVILTETKLDKKKREVVEICLPDQWRIYQMHIAQLKRIYYLDIPDAYEKLNRVFPPLNVRSFGDFFYEVDELTK
jgi:hypothetical protein